MSDRQKTHAAAAALDYVEDGMTIGLGSGSTAEIFVKVIFFSGPESVIRHRQNMAELFKLTEHHLTLNYRAALRDSPV